MISPYAITVLRLTRKFSWLIFLSLPTLFLLFRIPPIFNSLDSTSLLFFSLEKLVPHHPPVYPCLVKLFSTNNNFGATNVYQLLIVQHVIELASMSYLVVLARTTLHRMLFSLLILCGHYFCLIAHGIFTESIAISFIAFYVGTFVRLCLMDKSHWRLSAFLLKVRPLELKALELRVSALNAITLLSFASFYVLALCKHSMAPLAVLIPCFWLFQLIAARKPDRIAYFKNFTGGLLLAVLTLSLVHQTNLAAAKELNSQVDLILGRAAVYRMQALPWNSISPIEKDKLITSMQERTKNSFVKLAIPLMIADEQPWFGSYQKLKAIGKRFYPEANIDKVMNSASIAFYLTPNKLLYADILRDVGFYWCRNEKCLEAYVSNSKYSVGKYKTSDDPIIESNSFFKSINPNDYDRLRFLTESIFDSCCNFYLLGTLAVIISIVRYVLGRARASLIPMICSLIVAAFAYSFVTAIVTVTLTRYVAPMNEIIWLTLALSLFAGSIPRESAES